MKTQYSRETMLGFWKATKEALKIVSFYQKKRRIIPMGAWE